MIIAKLQQRRTHLETFGALHEPPPVGAAAKLAVGDDLEPGRLLHADRVAHAIVLDAHEFIRADLVAGAATECLAQCRWTQQATDVVGAKRRAAVRAQAHAWSLPTPSFFSIAQ